MVSQYLTIESGLMAFAGPVLMGALNFLILPRW